MSRLTELLFVPSLLFLSVVTSSFSFGTEPRVIRPEVRTVASNWFGFEYEEIIRPRIALVLSGGGARGIAQIGVLKTLEKHGIPVDFVAATSLGSIVGGLYASGYSPAELESLAVHTDWNEILSLTQDTKRSDLFAAQKRESDRTFFSLRFEGFEPVLPAAVSSGQRLTNFLNTLVLQSVYHSTESFDDLRIPFRAVSTDLISGRRVVMSEGSLAEALRASATVPLLFNPVVRDSLRLIDGGLVSNVPVDVAREEGIDLVLAVNTTSGMRNEEELTAPWQTADQIMSIMMQFANKGQLENADFVITPDLGRHLSSDFSQIQSLIDEGERAAEQLVSAIQAEYARLSFGPQVVDSVFGSATVERGSWDHLTSWNLWLARMQGNVNSEHDVQRFVQLMFASGELRDIRAEIHADQSPVRVVFHAAPAPLITDIRFSGVTLLGEEELEDEIPGAPGSIASPKIMISLLENVLRVYREKGYSLARVEQARFDAQTGQLRVTVGEGIVDRIEIEGNERTKDYVVRREFPMREGDVFEISKAREGISNINGTTLFDYVQLDVGYYSRRPQVTIRLRERPSQLLSIGIHSDNERNLQGLVEVRDDNIWGSGSSLGVSVSGGSRNQDYILDYHSHRIFSSSFSFRTALFFRVFDSYYFADAAGTAPDCWRRDEVGEYRDRRFGGHIAFGTQLERVGNAYVEYSLQSVKVKNLVDVPFIGEEYDLSRIRLGTLVDSKNSYPFPTEGVGMDFSFEFAVEGLLGGDVGYNALRAMYETFATWGEQHTLHPTLTIGFADKTMPFGEQFRLGGRHMMFGTREDDKRGRQLLLLNVEYRWRFPFQILFDTYFHLRYDLGTISEIPEQIKLSTFRHGIGAELSFDTPIGPGSIGAGKSFFFSNENPLQQGPLLFYFMIGYQLF